MKLVSGNSNRLLAENIAKYLETPLADCTVKKFSDKEIFIEMNENCRGEDVFIIQSTSFPANDNLMELLILIDIVHSRSPPPSPPPSLRPSLSSSYVTLLTL